MPHHSMIMGSADGKGVLLFLFTDGIKRDVTSKGTKKEICSFCTAEGNRKKTVATHGEVNALNIWIHSG